MAQSPLTLSQALWEPPKGRVLEGVFQRPLHAVELQGLDFVARGDLDRVQVPAAGGQVFHGILPCPWCE